MRQITKVTDIIWRCFSSDHLSLPFRPSYCSEMLFCTNCFLCHNWYQNNVFLFLMKMLYLGVELDNCIMMLFHIFGSRLLKSEALKCIHPNEKMLFVAVPP